MLYVRPVKVFVSWSKSRAHSVALAMREWLPTVIQECRDIFVSSEQEKGVAWFANIAQNLDSAAVGLVLITPENQHEQWLNFEGGALLGHFDEKRVCPVLLWMTPAEYSGPLANLHMTSAGQKDDVLKLLKKINALSESPIDPGILEKAHDRAWPELEAAIEAAREGEGAVDPKRTDSDKLDEMLGILRELRRAESNAASKERAEGWTPLLVRKNRVQTPVGTLETSVVNDATTTFIEQWLAENGDKRVSDLRDDRSNDSGGRGTEFSTTEDES